MGKVFLRIRKPNQTTQDGIPTDAIATVEVSGNYIVDITGQDTQNPRVSLNTTELKLYSGSSDVTSASGVELHAIVVRENDGDAFGKLEEIRVIKRGSNVQSTDKVRVLLKGKTDFDGSNGTDYAEFTPTLGGGDPDTELVLIAEDGQAAAGVDGLFVNLGAKGELPSSWKETDYKSNFFEAGNAFADVNEVKLFDPYQKKIDYSDVKAFATGPLITTIGSYQALSAIKQTESQIAQANKKAEALAAEAARINIQLKEGYEADKIYAEWEALDNYYIDIEEWQSLTGDDILQFTNPVDGPSSDAVWDAAVKATSNLLDVYKALGLPIPWNFSLIPGAIDEYELDPDSVQFPTLAAPNYPDEPSYLNETFNPIQAPDKLKYYERIAKGFLIKAICFAAIATLGGIYSRLKGPNTAITKSSANKVNYSARVWSANNRDGIFTSWFKSEMRAHDLFAHLLAIFDSIGVLVSAVKNSFDPSEVNSDLNQRLIAMTNAGVAAGYIESLKSLYELLGNWVNFYTAKRNEALAKSGNVFGFSSVTEFQKFTQKLEIIRGRIAVELDGVAYAWQTPADQSGTTYQQIQPRVTLQRDNNKRNTSSGITSVELENKGVFLPGGYFSGGTHSATLSEEDEISLKYGFFGTLPTYGLEAIPVFGGKPNITINIENGSLDSATINSQGQGFYWLNQSAIVRVPANMWFNVDNKTRSILADGQTSENVNEPDLNANEHKLGADAEINDGNYAGSDLNRKYGHIATSLITFSRDITRKLVAEARNTNNVIEYLKNTSTQDIHYGVDAAGFEGLVSIKTWTPTLGECSNQEIQKMDDDLAKTFFVDPGAYQVKINPQRTKELLCQKKSCGVAHVYSQPPMIDELEEAPMCGNVTVKYNLHPTAEWRITNFNAGGFFKQVFQINSSLDITKHLRIKDGADQTWSSGRPAGTDGDITLPAVFGNYTFAFENDKQGWSLGGLFAGILKIATLSLVSTDSTLKDPRITFPINEYHQALLNSYNANRLFRTENFEVNTGVIVNAATTNLAPAKTNNGLWAPQDTSDYFEKHSDSLLTAYQDVADAGGINAVNEQLADNSLAGAKEITPLLSVKQTFSGICFPQVTQFDIAKRPYRQIVGPHDLRRWGPTSNDKQKYEEFSIGRGDGNKNPGGNHLPIDGKSLGIADDSAGRAGGNLGLSANKEVFISETPYFEGVYRQVQSKIHELSNRTPYLEIEDVSIITKIKEEGSGLYAGVADKLDAAQASSTPDSALQDRYCIDVEGYRQEAQPAHAKGYWENGTKHEAWDSNNLKKNYNVPYYFEDQVGGNSYISGAGATSGAAYTDATSQYATYREWVNVFHLTGQHLFKLGARDSIEETYEKTGYHATSPTDAEQSGFNLLEQEPAWLAARDEFDSEGERLARSGVKSNMAISPINWNGDSCNGSWQDAVGGALPVDPASVGTQAKQYFAKGHSSSAADTAFLSEKCTQCSEGLITETQTKTTISFSGSITGVGASNDAALTNAMNALNTYSNTQYNLYGTGLNAARTSPVNTAGTDAHNFFTTGATTYEGSEQQAFTTGCSGISLNSHGYKTHAFESISEYQHVKIGYGLVDEFSVTGQVHDAGADLGITCNHIDANTSDADILASGIDGSLNSCTVSIIDPTGTHSVYGQTVPDPTNVYSQYGIENFWQTVSGLRNKKYQEARESLQREEWSSNWTASVGGSGIHNDYYANRVTGGAYSFSDIQNGHLAVYPNSGALRRVSGWNDYEYNDIPAEGASWPSVTNRMAWWANEYSDLAQAALVSLVSGTVSSWQFTVNLKNYTNGSGDVDIWVDEYVQFQHQLANLPITDGGGNVGNGYNNYYHSGGYPVSENIGYRSIDQYGWRTAIFKPKDANNLKLGEQPTECTVVGSVTSTTPLTAPTVYTGQGNCNLYNDYVYQSVVTGDYASVKAKCFIPLYRNEYVASGAISGGYPTVTGVCDWSSKRKQVWTDDNYDTLAASSLGLSETSANWNGSLFKPIAEGKSYQGEKYYLKYPEGTEGLMSSWAVTGNKRLTESEKTAAESYAPSNENPTTAVEGFNSAGNIAPSKQLNPLDLENITELVTDDVSQEDSSKYFLGGWPVKNQASTETSVVKNHTASNRTASAFEDEYLITETAESKIIAAVLKSTSKFKNAKITFVKDSQLQTQIQKVRNSQSNIESIDAEVLKIKYNSDTEELKIDFDGHKNIGNKKGKAGSLGNFWTNTKAKKNLMASPEGIDVFYYKIKYNAAACQACVISPAEDLVDKPVVFYHENYLQFAQVDWEMRSGQYLFEVPYLEPGTKFIQDGTEVTAKHWSEYINYSFLNNANDNYTGHYTAYGEAFVGVPTQLGCPEEHDSASKMGKIVDYQIGFGKDASYRKLKDLNTNEILFDRKGRKGSWPSDQGK